MPRRADPKTAFLRWSVLKSIVQQHVRAYQTGFRGLAGRNRLRHARLTCDLDYLQLDDKGGGGLSHSLCLMAARCVAQVTIIA
jgi:hypothetical protein